MQEGFGYLQQIGASTLAKDLVASAKALRALPEVDGKMAAIGFCAGGTLAFLLAAEGTVDAAVSYYGGGNQGAADRAKDVKVPILFHYGADDSHITPEAVDAVKKAFAGHESATFHVHDGAGHGFNCWARGSYNQKVAVFARGQTLQFLSKSLCSATLRRPGAPRSGRAGPYSGPAERAAEGRLRSPKSSTAAAQRRKGGCEKWRRRSQLSERASSVISM